MKKEIILPLFLLFFVSLGVVFSNADSYILKKSKDFQVELATQNDQNSASFNFADYDIEAPEVCKQSNIYCHEKTVITAHVEKEWEVITVKSIWDPTLTPQELSQYYPDLNTNQILTDGSKPAEKWIAQRILYERGLLDVFPTGKIGYKTEKAIADLQYYKGFEEADVKKGIIIIGPKTLAELNKLKDRMADPKFISRSGLPEIPFEKRSEFQQKRLPQIDSSLKTSTNTSKAQALPIIKTGSKGDAIKFSGEVEIKVQTEQ